MLVISSDFGKIQSDLNEVIRKETEIRNHIFSQLGYLSAQDSKEIFQPLLLSFQQVVAAAGASLTVYVREKQMLVFQYATGLSSESLVGLEVPLKGTELGMAFVSGEATASRPLAEDIQKQTGDEHDSLLAAPLILGEESIGTISAVNKEGGNGFTEQDIEAAMQFAGVAAQLVRFQSGLRTLEKAIEPSEPDTLGILESDQRLFELNQGIARLVQRDDSWLEDLKLFVQQAEKHIR